MSARELPSALRAGIARYCEAATPKDLARRASAISENYRGRGDSQSIRDETDAGAYLTARMPATYAAMTSVLDTVHERAPEFAPSSILDIGAGPGTASWAAAEMWPDLESVTMLDRNRTLLSAARALAEESAVLRRARFVEGGIAALDASADLVLAGYALAELPDAMLEHAVHTLWSACKGVLVIVEPGTPDGFARILRCRTMLLTLGARIAAPCPGDYNCPVVQPDWCHFAVRLPRLRAHMRAKAANVPFEDEKFSYLAAAREHVALAPIGSRILSRPQTTKPGIRLRLCAEGKIAERTMAKRDKDAYRAAAKKDWGDTV